MNDRCPTTVICQVTWAICAGSVLAIAVMAVRLTTDPLSSPVRGVVLLGGFGFPFPVLGWAAWAARLTIVPPILLLVLTVVTALLGVGNAYLEMDLEMSLMEAELLGRCLMACGPPPVVLFPPIGVVVSLVAGLLAAVGHKPPLKAQHLLNDS